MKPAAFTELHFVFVYVVYDQGLQITGKQRISAWDLMEGSKNPSPLSWAWFGAVRIERKPLKYEQDFRRLLHHTHPRRRPLSYFLNPAPDKDDEQDEDDERTEADVAAVDRSSQPSTPQTPSDGRGLYELSLQAYLGGDRIGAPPSCRMKVVEGWGESKCSRDEDE